MKLVAILIKDHSFLFEPDQVINLGGKYLYSFKKGSICDSLVIKRTLNPEFIDSFWGENISLASAIVGENGTGKTTIYRELLHNENLILIFEDFESKTSFIKNNISNLTTYFKKLNFEDDVYKVTISEINKRDHMGISIMETSLLKPYFKYYSPNMMYNVDLWDLFDEVKDDGGSKYRDITEIRYNQILLDIKLLSNKVLIDKLQGVYSSIFFYDELKIYFRKVSWNSEGKQKFVKAYSEKYQREVLNASIEKLSNISLHHSDSEEKKITKQKEIFFLSLLLIIIDYLRHLGLLHKKAILFEKLDKANKDKNIDIYKTIVEDLFTLEAEMESNENIAKLLPLKKTIMSFLEVLPDNLT